MWSIASKFSSHICVKLDTRVTMAFKLQVVRKLALVTLTGYMERYCPSHRSGWNWELGGVTKFIKKIKAPDYKGKPEEIINVYLWFGAN